MKCPVCLKSKISPEGVVDRFQPSFKIFRCNSCQSLFQYPVPPSLEKLYDEDYYTGKAQFSYMDERNAEKYNRYVWDARIKNIRSFQKSGIFIDIGCSFGGLVRSASNYFDAYGLDISQYAVKNGNEFSKKYSLNPGFKGLMNGSLTNLPKGLFEESSVSVITMIEVIEHLKAPLDHVKSAFKLLKNNGVLVLQTANMSAYQAQSEGLNYHYYLPGHLTYFSREGLIEMLKTIGFSGYREYFPVDFGLIPKLRKLSGSLKNPFDLIKLWKASKYHFISYLKKNGGPRTSSYVIYAFK